MYVISVTYKGDLFKKLFDPNTHYIYDEINTHYIRDIFKEREVAADFDGIVNCIRDCSKDEILLDVVRLAVEFGATSDQVTKLLTFCQVEIGDRHISFYESNAYYSVECSINLKLKQPTRVTISTKEFNSITRCITSDFSIRFDGLFRKVDIADSLIDIVKTYSGALNGENELDILVDIIDIIRKYVNEFDSEPGCLTLTNIECGNIESMTIQVSKCICEQ